MKPSPPKNEVLFCVNMLALTPGPPSSSIHSKQCVRAVEGGSEGVKKSDNAR